MVNVKYMPLPTAPIKLSRDMKIMVKEAIAMESIVVEVIETYKYQIPINANTYTEALNKVKAGYDNAMFDPEYDGVFLADALSHKKTTFKVIK